MVAFVASRCPVAQAGLTVLGDRYNHTGAVQADVIVARGRDGFMLQYGGKVLGCSISAIDRDKWLLI